MERKQHNAIISCLCCFRVNSQSRSSPLQSCLSFIALPTCSTNPPPQVAAGFVLHVGKTAVGSFQVGDSVTVAVDYERRGRIRPNHTLTHVLNFALK